MMTRFVAILVTGASLVRGHGAPVSSQVDGAQPTATTYVAVVDRHERPVASLGTADFRVRVDGGDRSVVSVKAAASAPAIILVVDGFTEEQALQVRKALQAVVGEIRGRAPQATVALMADESCVTPTWHAVSAIDQLDRQVSAFIRSGLAAPLLECLTVAANALAASPASRRHLLVLTSQSDSVRGAPTRTTTADAIQRSGASLWVLQSSLPRFQWPSAIDTEHVLRTIPAASGGRRWQRWTWLIADNATALARVMLSQYAVTYALPATTGPGVLRVGVTREDVDVLAPGWVSR